MSHECCPECGAVLVTRAQLSSREVGDILRRFDRGEHVAYIASTLGRASKTIYNQLHRASRQVRSQRARHERLTGNLAARNWRNINSIEHSSTEVATDADSAEPDAGATPS